MMLLQKYLEEKMNKREITKIRFDQLASEVEDYIAKWKNSKPSWIYLHDVEKAFPSADKKVLAMLCRKFYVWEQ